MLGEPIVLPCTADPPCAHPRHIHDEFADGTFGDCWLCDCKGNHNPRTDHETTKTFDKGDL